ncbi:hypothetical protein BKA83DRAFT_4496185 [Pisolithus microcarpus]|nr:hypothetical protein BKA83DRAFT_4496185 [Pisolithus microcarpus]
MSKSLTLEDDNEILQSFSISLTVYTKVKKTIQGKTMSKEEKSAKMKELLFTINGLNYLEFLHSILFKHGLKDYEVTEKKKFPLKLEKMYKNNCDEELTYVGPLGAVPLTPAMICDWCIALEDRQATINIPPTIPSFDLANKAPILHPTCKAAAHLSLPSINAKSLMLVLLLQMLTQSSLLTASQQVTPQGSAMPCTPYKGPATPCTPSCNQTNLGMCYAISYKSIFEMHGISPDILPDVDDKLLSEFGISPGDAICLKKGSMAWWNGPDAKHKQSKASASASTEEAQQLPAK